MPASKPVRAKKTSSATAASSPAKSARGRKAPNVSQRAWIAGAIALVVVGVAAVLMFAGHDASQMTGVATVQAASAASPSPGPVKKAGAPKAPGTPAIGETEPASARVSGAVEVTGCLQRADGGFVLKDTDGSAAPRSRSWKSGFLKKNSASLDLSDASRAAHLSEHVGQRVSVTGTLIDRQMSVQSLRRLAATCE